MWLCGLLGIHLKFKLKILTMKKLFLTLLTMPTVVGAVLPLVMHSAAQAAQSTQAAQSKNGNSPFCLTSHGKSFCVDGDWLKF
jgi:hypothetical protein